MSEAEDEIDALLRQVPEGEARPLDVAELLAVRGGRIEDEAIAAVEARLADDADARGLFAELDAEAEDRQLRKAVEAGMREPESAHPGVRKWPWAFGGGALALAAALVLFFVRPGIIELPAYDLSASPGVAALRGEAKATDLFLPDTELKLIGTPARAVRPAPTVHVFVSRPKGPLTRVQIPIKSGVGGAWRITAPASTWFGKAFGRWQAHVAVVPPGVPLDIGPKTTAAAARDRHPDVRWLSTDVQYREERP